MSVNWIEQKIIFVERPENPIDVKKSTLQSAKTIINFHTPIAVLRCTSSPSLFYYVVENISVPVIRLLTLLNLTKNRIPIQKKI
jgi:hypothetical protein